MRLELHIGDQVITGEDVNELIEMTEGIQDPWVLYAIYQSVWKEEPVPVKVDGRKNRYKRMPRLIVVHKMLPYDQVEKAAHWLSQKYAKNHIAKRLYCPIAQLTRSLIAYTVTSTKEEYDRYNSVKNNLVESK